MLVVYTFKLLCEAAAQSGFYGALCYEAVYLLSQTVGNAMQHDEHVKRLSQKHKLHAISTFRHITYMVNNISTYPGSSRHNRFSLGTFKPNVDVIA